MSLKILKQLSSEIAQNRLSVPAFCEITNDSYLLAKNYSNPIGRSSKPTAEPELSNVYDFSTGEQITFGDLEWNDYEMCFPIWNLYTNKNIH